MKLSKLSRKFVGLIAFFFITSGVSGCDEGEDIKNWVENTDKLRTTAEQQSEIVPYRQDQFKALKAYFVELNQMALALKNDSKFAERFNKGVAEASLKETCPKVFLTRAEWQVMVERCTRNRFFLCAEEVRAYPEMVAAVRGKLVGEQQKRFDQTPSCKAAL